MITPRTRPLVSLAAALTFTLALGACAGGASSPARGAPTAMEALAPAIRFDNDAREHVHVYLVGEERQWLLGRVAPGAKATLRIPEAAFAEGGATMRLAVLEGGRLTLEAARSAGAATFTMAQPATSLLAQRWMFVQGQLTSLRR